MKSSATKDVSAAKEVSGPPRLRVNILANIAGRASYTLITIILTPLYIKLLGIEAYGLIGFYLTLQVSVGFMEMGLSRACARELARHSNQDSDSDQLILDTARSLEVLYWAIAGFIGLSLTFAAPWIAAYWLDSSEFTNDELSNILVIMAWVIALRWPMGLYNGMLIGMQRLVRMNVALVTFAVLSGGGAVIVLWLVSPSIGAYFQWQAFSALVSVIFLGVLAWRTTPGSFTQGFFSLHLLKGLMPFAAAVGLNGILGTILRQADKLIVSALLPLREFSYYALVSLMVGILPTIVETISTAIFPRFARLVGSGAPSSDIARKYHETSQAVAALIVPVGIAIAFYSAEVLELYTANQDVADNAAQILTVLVIAKMLHSSMIIPYALQLAYGWVRLSIYLNIAAVIWLVPATYLLTQLYGALGAALAWLVVTIGYVVVGLPMMHSRLLVGEWRRWIINSLLKPLTVVCLFWLVIKLSVGDITGTRYWRIAFFLLLGSVSIIIAACCMDSLRERLFRIKGVKW